MVEVDVSVLFVFTLTLSAETTKLSSALAILIVLSAVKSPPPVKPFPAVIVRDVSTLLLNSDVMLNVSKRSVVLFHLRTSPPAKVDNLTTVNAFNYNGAPLIVIGNTAPTSSPDFVGQTYINTTAPGTVYSAKGNASVSDWKQTSN